MGYNSGILLLNDAMGNLDDNDTLIEWWRNMRGAVNGMGRKMDVPVGNHVNGSTLFHMSHADSVGVYAIGGNCTSRLLLTYNGGRHHAEENRIQLLRQAADELGYRLVKKPQEKDVPGRK